MFRYVTHLDILDDSGVEKLLLDIRLLPALTHFSLDSDTPQASALRVVEECPRLELLFVHWFDELLYKASQTPHAYDIRFLMGLCDDYWNDWELGVRGGADFWARGDDFVRRKRRGEIEGKRLDSSKPPYFSCIRCSYPVLVGLSWSADICPACMLSPPGSQLIGATAEREMCWDLDAALRGARTRLFRVIQFPRVTYCYKYPKIETKKKT
jgi:hypothetical protein